MSLLRALRTTDLNHSLLFGFYGGGNYGDELLLEVLAGLLKQQEARDVHIAYQQPDNYDIFHHDFGYPRVDMRDRRALLGTIRRKRAVIVGGGGLWGMDVNSNIFLMSLMLFACRWLLGKRVYLLGVGYYDSTSRLGHISAWLAGKAANHIIARDQETYDNFARVNGHTELDTDMAWHITELELSSYQADLAALEQRVRPNGPTLFITLRRFNDNTQSHLQKVVADSLERNQKKAVIIALMEPRQVDPDSYAQLEAWQRQYPNIQVLDFSFNPLALFLFFRKYQQQLTFIGPQFHGILSAHLAGVPYLPLAYDNKVQNLLQYLNPDRPALPIQALRPADIQRFVDGAFKKA